MKEPKDFDEARARILWGEPVEEVRQFLLSKDCSRIEADQWIAGFTAERRKEIRKTGIRKIAIGVLLLAMAVGCFFLFQEAVESRRGGRNAGGGFLTMMLLGLVFGIGKLVDGVFYLLRPQLETKSISDLSD